MGNIKKLLSLEKTEPRVITPNMTWTDLCENVHLHFRNIRLDFSEVEFAHFRAAVNSCGVALEKCSEENDYKEGNPNFLIQQMFNIPMNTDSDYYPNRIVLEQNKDSTFHFHYRDLRLHLTEGEFMLLCKMFAQAAVKLKNGKPFPYSDLEERYRSWIEIDRIQPYDGGHKPGVIDEDHRKGIEYAKSLIRKGSRMRPILVNNTGQRLDGFKRYMAAKELGKDSIECIIDPWGKMGGQHNQSMLDDKEDIEDGKENNVG